MTDGLRILVAPDSFKGSLSSVEVAQAICEGWRRARPSDTIELVPLADGGEGLLEAISLAGGWEWRSADVADPLERSIRARWLRSSDGSRAVVEMAAASGLSRVAPADRDPLLATTRGTGELVRAVLDAGVRTVLLGVGGSATTDGGRGLLEALGARFSGSEPVAVDLTGLDPRLSELGVRVACDVTNPLLGPDGAAAVYGPQKGATPDNVAALDARLARLADVLEGAVGRRDRDMPGSGAAGGITFGLACIRDRLRSFELRPGIELVMEEVGFDAKLAAADLVLTGEGRIDRQTAFGKTAWGVARRAAAAGIPCVALAGGVDEDGAAALASIGAVAVPVVERPIRVEEAMAAGSGPLIRAGERIARLVTLGRRLGAAS